MNTIPEEALVADDADDLSMQQDFVDSGAVFPKVEADAISALMRKVTYDVHQIPDTTTIVATAILAQGNHKFTLAHESTACADPRNFNKEKGEFYAVQKASKAARDKLWELEGYRLFRDLASK